MKLSRTFVSILFSILLLQIPLPCLPAGGTDKKHLQELAARYEEAALGDDMQKELEVLETYLAEAIRQKDLREESYARMQKLNCFFNYEAFDRLYAEIPVQAAFFREQGQWDRYYTIQEIEVEALMLQNRTESALRKARCIYEEAQKANHREGLGTSSYCIAYIYHLTQNEPEAERYMREAIRLLEYDPDNTLLVFCYVELGDILLSQGKYPDMLHFAAQQEARIKRVEEKAKSENLVVDYSAHWYQCFYNYANAYIGLKQKDKAHEYYQKAHQYGYQHSAVQAGLLMTAASLAELDGDLPQAIETTDSLTRFYKDSDSRPLLLAQTEKKAALLLQNKQYEASALTYREALMLKDSVNDHRSAAQLNDLRSIYELDSLTAEKEKNRLYFVFALSGCLFLAILLAVYALYSRRLKEKNRALLDRIREQARREEEQARQELEAAASTDTAIETADTPETPPAATKEELLVRKARIYLRTDRRFTDTELNRKQIADALGTNEKYIADAIRNQNNGQTVGDFVNEMRLAYARDLLIEDSGLTVEAIAMECGLQSRTTLFRLFRKHYGMSPSELRKAMRDSS